VGRREGQDPSRVRGRKGIVRFEKRGPRGGDVVDQQHGSTPDDLPLVRRQRERAANIPPPLVRAAAGLGGRVPHAAQGVDHRHAPPGADVLRQKRRLIESPGGAPRNVERNGNDHGLAPEALRYSGRLGHQRGQPATQA